MCAWPSHLTTVGNYTQTHSQNRPRRKRVSKRNVEATSSQAVIRSRFIPMLHESWIKMAVFHKLISLLSSGNWGCVVISFIQLCHCVELSITTVLTTESLEDALFIPIITHDEDVYWWDSLNRCFRTIPVKTCFNVNKNQINEDEHLMYWLIIR